METRRKVKLFAISNIIVINWPLYNPIAIVDKNPLPVPDAINGTSANKIVIGVLAAATLEPDLTITPMIAPSMVEHKIPSITISKNCGIYISSKWSKGKNKQDVTILSTNTKLPTPSKYCNGLTFESINTLKVCLSFSSAISAAVIINGIIDICIVRKIKGFVPASPFIMAVIK